MIRLITLALLGLFTLIDLKAQEPANIDVLHAIEDHILLEESDAAAKLLDNVPSTRYVELLKKINSKEKITGDYTLLINFIVEAGKRHNGNNYRPISRLLEQSIKIPQNNADYNYSYALVIYRDITALRNNGLLEEAGKKNEILKSYLQNFSPEDPEVIKGNIMAQFHPIVMHLIQNEHAKGAELCKIAAKQAESINDTDLWVGSMYHHADFLISPQTKDEYIALSEKCYALDKNRKKKSHYYTPNVEHLLGVYGYSGGYDDRLWELVSELYHQPKYREASINFHLIYLRYLPPASQYVDSVLNRFNCNSILDFCSYQDSIGSVTLDPQVKLRQIDDIIASLRNHNHLSEALDFAQKRNFAARKFFTQKIAKDLANYETDKVKMAKEIEVKNEKEKAKISIWVSVLSGLLLIVLVWAFILQRKQNKILEEKNHEIEKQRDEILKRDEEKAVLLKEIHHRVKNNFQVVSSLLEMQSRNIDNPELKELTIEGKNRIKSMALIHQRLYENDALEIEFNEYINKLIEEIAFQFGQDEKIKANVETQNLSFDIDTAIPLGLILNELITNAFKYGMTDLEKSISVSIATTDQHVYQLTVEDNGKGLAEGIDPLTTKSMGLKLVRRLAQQLLGNLEYDNNTGSKFTVTFMDTKGRLGYE